MSDRTAHVLDQKWRSDDIKIWEDADFSSLLLPKKILKALKVAGYKYPSPIQLKAIPAGKIGKDLIVQAKSGTGKTLVFTVVALNMLLEGAKHPQVLIMAPTREIACQICQVVKSVGYHCKGLKCEYFIGGRRLEEDVPRIDGCQVIVGTPGRIKQLINFKILKTGGIRLFVFDEADQLLKESSFTTDIDDIFRALPRDKQIIATSATYPPKLKKLTHKYFRDPLLIRLNREDIGLLGMVHYYRIIPVTNLPIVAYKEKLVVLENVLLNVKFAQCLVFCNMVTRVEPLCVEIKKMGFSTCFISSAREQPERLQAIELLKKFKCKVLVTSDITSRGIDAENVDLVINFDFPRYLDTYFHRVGRAGRYGSKCASVTFIISDEIEAYQQMQTDGKFKSYPLPDCVPEDLISLQPQIKPGIKNEELPLDDKSQSTSDSSSDAEDFIENGVVKQQKVNDFVEDIELNGHSNSSCNSEVNEFASENLTNPSDKIVDSEVASTESSNSPETQNQLLDVNSNATNSEKGDSLRRISESVELESDKTDSPDFPKLKQQEVVLEISSSTENVIAEKENNWKVDKSDGEESCENDNLVERKYDQQSSVTSVVENTENCHSKSGVLASNDHVLQQVTDTSSCLVQLENNSEKSLKEKIIDYKSLVMNNEDNSSKNFNDPKSKELITSFITFIEEYENSNKGNEECSTTDSTKSSQSINIESNDDRFLVGHLKNLRSSLNEFHYNVRKEFIIQKLNTEILINGIAEGYGKEKNVNEVSEIEEKECLNQNEAENKILSSRLDSQLRLFSTPKTEAFLSVKSDDSSDLESSSGSDKRNLIEHFNSRLSNIRKVEPSASKNSLSESSSDSESSSGTSVNSGDALCLLAKKFNQMSQERAKGCNKEAANKVMGKANIINNVESSGDSSSSGSDSGTSIDSENLTDELEQKLAEFRKAKRCGRDFSKNTEETKQILNELRNTKKCFNDIEIAGSKKHIESPRHTSSDSDAPLGSGKAKIEHKKEFNKSIQNGKSKVLDTKKSSKSSRYKTKTVNGLAENKITYYYSQTESDVDQYVEDTPSPLQGHQRKTPKKAKAVSKTRYRTKTVKGAAENKITYYYSAASSETENDSDQYSKESGFSVPANRQRKIKSHKKGETLPKTEHSQFEYSNANRTSNPYFNPASEGQIYGQPHSNYQMPPSCYASNPYNRQYSQQEQNHAIQGPFLSAHSNFQMQPTCYASNVYYPPYPQQIQSYVNDGQFLGTQFNNQMQPYPFVPNLLSQPYPSECPLKESCQNSKTQLGSKPAGGRCTVGCSTENSNNQRGSNAPINHVQSNHQMQLSHAYNQCFTPSQHPCHPPNQSCQSPACAAWYDIFYKQWQFMNQSPYF